MASFLDKKTNLSHMFIVVLSWVTSTWYFRWYQWVHGTESIYDWARIYNRAHNNV